MIYGLLHLSFWGYGIAFIIMSQLTIMSVTLYLHRSQAHRALDLHPVIQHICRAWLWLSTGMSTKAWTAIHRKHHAKCETAEDPHSPQRMGLPKVLWQGAELYRKEALNQETIERYGQGTPDDWLENHLYIAHGMLGIGLMFLLDVILFGVPGITMWALQMMWIPFCAAGIINGIGHYFGYRNYECPDAARNIVPWGLILGGEELHNNHHAFGSSAKFSVKWWEVDMGWGLIKILQFFGLAKIKKVSPKLLSLPDKKAIDAETIKVIILNRLQVLSHYSKEVTLPVLRAEKKSAKEKGEKFFFRARMLLIRELSLFKPWERSRLAILLRKKEALRQVYYYRIKLQKIWSVTTATQKELIEALQEWCKSAENSGILALEAFSRRLKSYVPYNGL
jgi:stearoyl-CoA desaturase (delta-9 desaturase)